ncbi:PREDICTED: uncharacterized protein LOC109589166 [Amphimedon queenslandica]|uniref:Uncharacterized protein n=1 Tax=Amphimedon queenslandica TaxID=400682 RepID=A0AAN0JVB9_AMPQE|nr:PREDICTED: uncharacterized protein LOC109589166 [Amphimedon queenslandica]|eukprot:XP_019860847.1 PREDICTED: uncharacterized protein LOC109589166 [Amphimedon queenslandica]
MASGHHKKIHKKLYSKYGRPGSIIQLETVLIKKLNQQEFELFQQKVLEDPPPTETRYVESLFVLFISNTFKKEGKYTKLGEILNKIKENERFNFKILVCRLAFLKVQGLNPDSVELSNALLQQGLESFTSADALGLIDVRTHHDEPYSAGNGYCFIDVLIQKFLAAVFLIWEPLMVLLDFIKQHVISQTNKLTEDGGEIGRDCSEVLTYVFGLAKCGLNDSLSDALPSIIQFMCQTIVTTEPIIDDRIALVILACLRQAQDFTLCRKVHHEHFKRQIFSYKFSFLDLTDLAYYLSCTSSEQQSWTIYYSDKVTGNSISSFLGSIYQQYKITVHSKLQPDITMKEQGRIVISNRNLDHLKSVLLSSVASVHSDMSMVLGMEAMQEGMSPTPHLPSADPSSTLSSLASPLPYKFGYISKEKYEAMQTAENVMYFNMVKDVMATSLQPYSKQPLECQYRKADHIWITGSQSLRHHFYKSVLIAPYVPMHWVKVKQPDGNPELEAKYERRANDEMSLPTVSPETSEIVLLNSHRYTQIAITTLTGEQSVISLYNNSEEAEPPGFIGCDYLAPSHELKGKVLWKELKPFDIVKDERVGRELPLPSKRGTESGDMTATTASKALDEDPDRFKPSTRPTSSVYDTTKSTAGGIRPLGVTTANEQQIKRQALEAFDTAGQCFYGDNIKFFSGKVYTQPNALPGARVLREGGNGLILEIYYEGISL